MGIKVRIPPSPRLTVLGNPRVFFFITCSYITSYFVNFIAWIIEKNLSFSKIVTQKFTYSFLVSFLPYIRKTLETAKKLIFDDRIHFCRPISDFFKSHLVDSIFPSLFLDLSAAKYQSTFFRCLLWKHIYGKQFFHLK